MFSPCLRLSSWGNLRGIPSSCTAPHSKNTKVNPYMKWPQEFWLRVSLTMVPLVSFRFLSKTEIRSYIYIATLHLAINSCLYYFIASLKIGVHFYRTFRFVVNLSLGSSCRSLSQWRTCARQWLQHQFLSQLLFSALLSSLIHLSNCSSFLARRRRWPLARWTYSGPTCWAWPWYH